MQVETKTLFIATLVGIAHIVCGVVVLITPAALKVTSLVALGDITTWLGFTQGFSGAVLISAGVLAVVASSQDLIAPVLLRVTMLLPQQVLLMLQAWSISVTLAAGHYPDGYVPVGGAWFVLSDQIWPWVLVVTHTVWLAAFLFSRTVKRTVNGRNR